MFEKMGAAWVRRLKAWRFFQVAQLGSHSALWASQKIPKRDPFRVLEEAQKIRASRPDNTLQSNTMHCIALHYSTLQYNPRQYNTIQYFALLCSSLHYNTVPYNTAVQYSTVQYNTIQYSTWHCMAWHYVAWHGTAWLNKILATDRRVLPPSRPFP